MSKIICDVCGTSYPDTADQCPICGSAKPEEAGDIKSYTYVKGGRFSSKNVNKRLQEKQMDYSYTQPVQSEEEEEDLGPSNKGLVVAVILLLLAIISIAAYLYLNYWMPSDPYAGNTTASTASTTEPSDTAQGDATDSTDVQTPVDVACQEIVLDTNEVTLNALGNGYLINFSLTPADTTELVTFASSDPAVATVDENGKITAAGPGTATVTVTCGTATSQITVICDIETEPTTEPTTVPTEEPAEKFELRSEDVTMKVGEAWDAYRGSIPNNKITWRSSDTSVATVDQGGVIKCVGAGTTTIYAEYNGQTYKCIVRVNPAS